jgi:hypothetical protein
MIRPWSIAGSRREVAGLPSGYDLVSGEDSPRLALALNARYIAEHEAPRSRVRRLSPRQRGIPAFRLMNSKLSSLGDLIRGSW